MNPTADAGNTLIIDESPTGPAAGAFWRFGVNTCHAPLLLRDDLMRHVRRGREALGFRNLRCHGILSDEMGVATAPGRYDFSRVFAVFDRLLAADVKPFVELSDMPGWLARGGASVCRYRFRSDPPSDFAEWRRLAAAFAGALVGRYGAEETRQWHFEVWNEPDIPFWTGTRAEYFRLYDLARNAIKEVDPALRVGGPATSKTAWIPEFVRHCSGPSADDPSPGPRCDFVSTHAYPSDLAFLDAAEGAVRPGPAGLLRDLYRKAREAVDAAFGPAMPLFIGEWNSSAGPLAENHDDANNAAFVCKIMAEVEPYCAGSLYWNLSDIYEECGFHYAPFHGGYGLLTVNDIPKAAFHAFRWLNTVAEGQRAAAYFSRSAEEHGALASADGDTRRALVWNYRQPEREGVPLRFTVADAGAGNGSIRRIRPGAGSAFETWRALGRPEYATAALLARLEAASVPEEADWSPSMPVHLDPGTVALLEWWR